MSMELDIRVVKPQDKHPKIFKTFDELKPGDYFVLINDHDPRPLRAQFHLQRPEQFGWEYLESGPLTWKVRISRTN